MKPFTAQRALVIEGGALKAPWVLDCTTIAGIDFAQLLMGDRSLARAMGMNMSARSPLQACEIFSHMIKLRDAKVDSLIASSKVADDPMADVQAIASITLPSLGRPQAFAKADVPGFVELSFDEFVTPEGVRIEAHVVKVVTTPKRGVALTIEAAPANFEWLRWACQVQWGSQRASTKRQLKRTLTLDELPDLEWPLKYGRDSAGGVVIMCHYRGEAGRWIRHQKRLDVSFKEDDVIMERMVRQCADAVLAFHAANDVEPSGHAEQAPVGDA